MENITTDSTDLGIWSLRLKSKLKQINPAYATLLDFVERLPAAVVTYDGWLLNYAGAFREQSQMEESMLTRMSADLYTLLVDKYTNVQVMMFENGELDGFYAFTVSSTDLPRGQRD